MSFSKSVEGSQMGWGLIELSAALRRGPPTSHKEVFTPIDLEPANEQVFLSVPTKNQKYETRAKACESARLLRGLVKLPGGT